MKRYRILFLLVVAVGSLKAQNPDGHGVSLHVSPSWGWGNAMYDRVAPIRIPQTQITDGYFESFRDTGTVQYPTSFGIDMMLKIPIASFLTVGVSYSYSQRFEELYTVVATNPKYAWYGWSLNGQMHRVGFTVSFYNLFSVY
jgi:hypothetical protein